MNSYMSMLAVKPFVRASEGEAAVTVGGDSAIESTGTSGWMLIGVRVNVFEKLLS